MAAMLSARKKESEFEERRYEEEKAVKEKEAKAEAARREAQQALDSRRLDMQQATEDRRVALEERKFEQEKEWNAAKATALTEAAKGLSEGLKLAGMAFTAWLQSQSQEKK